MTARVFSVACGSHAMNRFAEIGFVGLGDVTFGNRVAAKAASMPGVCANIGRAFSLRRNKKDTGTNRQSVLTKRMLIGNPMPLWLLLFLIIGDDYARLTRAGAG